MGKADDDASARACWARFRAAADDALDGHFARGHALIAKIRARSGDYAAETARRELRAFVAYQQEQRDARLRRINAALRPPGLDFSDERELELVELE